MAERELLGDIWARINPSVAKPRLHYSIMVGLVAAIGGLSFGYDLGVMASIFQMERFNDFMPDYIKSVKGADAPVKANIAGLFTIGCTLGSFFQGYASDFFGRKWAIIYGSVIATIGAIIQTATPDLPVLFLGRFITGLAIGMFSALVPVYMAETVIYTFRGMMVTSQQFMIVLGVLLAYITDYACFLNYRENEWQWRGPLFAQVLLGVVLLVGMLPLPKSPRWLLSKGKTEDALKSLAKLRMLPEDNEYVTTEFEEMQWAYQREIEVGTVTILQVLKDAPLRKRLVVISVINALQQLCGINGVNYFAPAIYRALGFGSTAMILLLQVFYGMMKLIMTIPTFFIVDRFGRKPLFYFGSVVMAISMFTLAIIFGVTTNGSTNGVEAILRSVPAAGWLGVGMIWFFVVGFNASWGPVTWVVSSEVFPLKVRSKAMAITATVQWFFNTTVVYIVPTWLAVHTYAVFILLGLFSVGSVAFIYLYLPETRNRTLEEMEIVWGVKRTIDIETAVDEKKPVVVEAAPASTQETKEKPAETASTEDSAPEANDKKVEETTEKGKVDDEKSPQA